MGKTYTVKTPPDDFKVTTLENPLLSKQAVTSKGILVPYTNLQLNPYPNTQLDLFCSDNLSFSMHGSQYVANCTDPSTRLDHQLEKDVDCKVLQFITRWRSWSCLVTKPYGAQTHQLLQELGQTRFQVTLVELCSCATCVTFYGPQNNPYICLELWEKKAQTCIHGLDENQLEKLNFINLDRYPICRVVVEPRAKTAFLNLDRC